MIVVVAGEARHCSRQMGKIAEIAALLELKAADARWEAHHLWTIDVAHRADRRVDPLEHPLEAAASTEQAVDAHRNQEPVVQQLIPKAPVGRGDGIRHASSSGSSRSTSPRFALFAAMRSLLTITTAEWASRSRRPMLKTESLR